MGWLCCLCCVVVAVSCLPAGAQDVYEDLLEGDGTVLDRSDLLERIEELKAHPVDINTASADDLSAIPWLSPILALRIVAYRKGVGRFSTGRELLNVEGIDDELLERIRPLVTAGVASRDPAVTGRIRARLVHGNRDDGIRGDDIFFREKIYTRGDFTLSERLTVQLVTEKDPGEHRFSDHAAYSVSLRNWHCFDTLVLGHFRAGFGQGLVLGDYSGSCSGAAVPHSLKKKSRGLGTYTSSSESGALFGMACSGRMKNLSLALFGSKTALDATLNDDGTVSSLYETGFHRTETERAKENLLSESLFGGHADYRFGDGARLGATVSQCRYDRTIDPKESERKQYAFRGNENTVGGLDVDLVWRRLNLFGELAGTIGAGNGIVTGAIIDFGRIEVDALLRRYSEDFYTFHNSAFAVDPEESQNESGALLALVCKPHRRTTIKTYIDRVRNPWRKYYEKMPPKREAFFALLDHRFPRNIQSRLRFRMQTKETNKTVEETSKNVRRRQIDLRGQVEWTPLEWMRIRERVERILVDYPDLGTKETGWLVHIDLRLTAGRVLTVNSRGTYWRTASYDSRLYAFENDLPGVMTNEALYGSGWRWYVLFTCRPGRGFSFSMKYSVSQFLDEGKQDTHTFGIHCEYSPRFGMRSK